MQFKDKKVIVTGANRSIGRSMAVAFAEQGADVVISYRSDEAGAQETVAAIKATGRDGLALYADFMQIEYIAGFAEQAISHLGHVDILVNNAGVEILDPILELSVEKMQQVFQVNAVAPLYLLQLCAKSMVEQQIKGCILNISSITALTTMSRGVGYAASKAALGKATQNVALNLAEYGIRVNAIAPGVVESGMNEGKATSDPERWADITEVIPLGRTGTPDDITNMALFLASDKATWVTGKVIAVDGGHVL